MSDYDSTEDTKEHIGKVQLNLLNVCTNLLKRSTAHDESKLKDPEKELFDQETPKLSKLTYGSQEYKDALGRLKPALDHHYANNSHHPEHYEDGVDGMSLLDLIEMLADWKAAVERHDDGSLKKSLEINKKRFKIGDQLQSILKNTCEELKWAKQK